MKGTYSVDYKADYTKVIHGTDNRSITGNKSTNIQNDKVDFVGRNVTSTVGGLKSEMVFGSATGNAVNQNIVAGNKVTTISGTGNFIRSTTAGSFEDSNNGGDYVINTTLGNYTLTVDGGNIIIKGGNPLLYNKIEMTQTGGVTITDTNLNKVEMTSSGVKVKEVGGATLNLSATKVALGNGVTELLDKFSYTLDLMSQTLDAIIIQTHATAVGPSGPPINAASFTAIKANVTLTKTAIDTLKGSV
jgi:hypothetical protein